MEKIKLQIMNFNTGLWSEWLPILVGNEGQFVYDKSTDSGKVSFKVYQETEPSFNIGDWVNIGHFDSEPYTLTFDSEGLPLNHEQYAIASVEMVQSKSKAFWTVNLALVEPIEMLRGVPTETLDFTNQTSKTVVEGGVDVEYLKDPFTQLTALERVLKVTPANNDDLSGVGRRYGSAWFNRIEILDKPFLNSLPFNDDTFSSGDLFTTLFKFDDYVDKTPVVYFDWLRPNDYANPFLFSTTNVTLELSTGGGILEVFYDKRYSFARTTGFTTNYTVNVFADYKVGYHYYIAETSGTNEHLFDLEITEIIGGSLLQVKGIMREYISTKQSNYILVDSTRPCYKLKFERKDGYDKVEQDYTELIENNTGLAVNKTLDNYATGIISEVDNLNSGVVLKYPSEKLWTVPEIETDERDVRGSTTSETDAQEQRTKWFIRTPNKIKNVIKVKRLLLSGHEEELTSNGIKRVWLERVNQTVDVKFVLEQQQYLANELFDTNKYDFFWFEQGTDKLYVNAYYSWQDDTTAIYYVEYEPLIDTSLQYGGGDYIISVNQSDSQTEAIKITKWLNSYLNAMNKPDILITKNYYNYTDFADLIGSRVVKEDEEYIITKVAYKNFNSGYVVVFSLNKDNFRRNINIRANEQIKPNRVIEYSNLKDRRTRIVERLKIDTQVVTNNLKHLNNKLLLLSGLLPTQLSSELYPQVALLKTYSSIYKTSLANFYDYEQDFLITFSSQINSGQVQFNVLLQNNAEIAKQKIPYFRTGTAGGGSVPEYTFRYYFGDVATQIPILYTDPFGEVQKISFVFSKVNVEEFSNYSTSLDYSAEAIAEHARTKDMYLTMANLPIINEDFREQLYDNAVFSVDNINYLKNMLEKGNFAFIFNLGSNNKNIIVCYELLRLSRLMQPTDTHTLKIMGFNKKMQENDLLTSGKLWETTVTSSYDASKITLGFTGQSTTNLKSLVITTNNNDKLLILNDLSDTNVAGGSVEIYY